MQRHWCTADRNWFDFEGECSWCGMREDAPQTTDEEFRLLMQRMEANARPDITDD